MYSILVGTLHKSTSSLYIILSEYDCCADNIIPSGGIYIPRVVKVQSTDD